MAQIDETLFDSRVVERNIEKGLITREDYDAYLGGLDDLADDAVDIESEYEVGVLDDEEDEEDETEDE